MSPKGPPAVPASLVYDSSDQVALWWGEVGAAGLTWEFANGSWTNLTSSSLAAPPTQYGAALSDDPSIGGVVWVGGADPAGSYTWEFSHGAWSNLTSTLSGRPPSRSYASTTWDPALSAVLLFGGWNGSAYLNDTWTLAYGNWTRLAVGGPSPRAGSGRAYAPGAGMAVLVGGGTTQGPISDAWGFSAGQWQALASAPPAGVGEGASLSTAPGGGLVAFGGTGCGAPVIGPCNLTVAWTGGAWVTYDGGFGPSPRLGLALVYDAAAGYVVAWGGAASSLAFNDTWTLGAPLSVIVSVAPAEVGVDDPTEFTAVASGGYGEYAYRWSGGPLDCPTANLSTILCASEIPGSYNVTAFITDSLGNTTSATAPLSVLALFAASLTIVPSIVDLAQPVHFAISTIGGAAAANFTWSGLPAGCPLVYVPAFDCQPVSTGYYSVVATAVDSLGHVALSAPTGLFVQPLPTVTILPSVARGVAPLSVNFSAVVTGGTAPFRYDWQFGDGNGSVLAHPLHSYQSPGAFIVTLEVTDARNATAWATIPQPLAVASPLLVPAPWASGHLEPGGPVGFVDNVSGGTPPYSLNWEFGDGTNSSAPSPTHTYPSAGSYTVLVVVNDSAGQQAWSTVHLEVPASTGAGWSGLTIALEDAGLLAVGIVVGAAVVWLLQRRRSRGTARSPLSDR